MSLPAKTTILLERTNQALSKYFLLMIILFIEFKTSTRTSIFIFALLGWKRLKFIQLFLLFKAKQLRNLRLLIFSNKMTYVAYQTNFAPLKTVLLKRINCNLLIKKKEKYGHLTILKIKYKALYKII
jgi:hypothetical protein